VDAIPTPTPGARSEGIGGLNGTDGRVALLCPLHGRMAVIARTRSDGGETTYWRCSWPRCRYESALWEPR
jgi:hypothetical protein